jgi:serine/threonine protein kinase
MILVDRPSPVSFLIDFGLAQRFRDPATYIHTPYSPHDPIVGTLLFTSITSHKGGTQSRRDDLESFAYTIIYAACGKLPWSSCRNPKAVLKKKLGIPIEELCRGLPAPFCDLVTYVRSLGFSAKPDYQHLHSILSLCSDTETDQPINAHQQKTTLLAVPCDFCALRVPCRFRRKPG